MAGLRRLQHLRLGTSRDLQLMFTLKGCAWDESNTRAGLREAALGWDPQLSGQSGALGASQFPASCRRIFTSPALPAPRCHTAGSLTCAACTWGAPMWRGTTL